MPATIHSTPNGQPPITYNEFTGLGSSEYDGIVYDGGDEFSRTLIGVYMDGGGNPRLMLIGGDNGTILLPASSDDFFPIRRSTRSVTFSN